MNFFPFSRDIITLVIVVFLVVSMSLLRRGNGRTPFPLLQRQHVLLLLMHLASLMHPQLLLLLLVEHVVRMMLVRRVKGALRHRVVIHFHVTSAT